MPMLTQSANANKEKKRIGDELKSIKTIVLMIIMCVVSKIESLKINLLHVNFENINKHHQNCSTALRSNSMERRFNV
ncbi:CLUMA_CG019239, isoform A [Clunio marinus]|uniref:CLUMA_CG019239, isoform A n=1 Tax=Clunio marinus TaxID=568069 RepID=A0A1J1J1E1_9DIPT|nr:CLUMA_CG019239, isoform A [Clunio marinus]